MVNNLADGFMEVLWATHVPFYVNLYVSFGSHVYGATGFVAPLLWQFYVDFYCRLMEVGCRFLWQFYGSFMQSFMAVLWYLHGSSLMATLC